MAEVAKFNPNARRGAVLKLRSLLASNLLTTNKEDAG
jgi:hypothetical protein